MLIQQAFEKEGGTFLNSAEEIAGKLKEIRCFVFDWDGVFNKGVKTELKGSPFSEPDSMGLNMLRFSYWLLHGELPVTAIITGENNLSAVDFAKREHLNAVYLNTKNKKEALTHLTNNYSIDPSQTAFVFDDILDLALAESCLLSFCIKRSASPLFTEFVTNNKLANYITAKEGGEHAVREITELLIGLNGNYNETVSKRMEHIGDYKKYITTRNSVIVEIPKTSANKK